MALKADQILAGAGVRRYEEVPAPEIGKGETVRIQSLFGNEQEDWEDGLERDKKTGKVKTNVMRASFAAAIIVDEHGEKQFAGKRMIDQLNSLPVSLLQRIFEAGRKLNGLTEEDIEELAEGFGRGTGEASTSN